jgi:hypothetical protein
MEASRSRREVDIQGRVAVKSQIIDLRGFMKASAVKKRQQTKSGEKKNSAGFRVSAAVSDRFIRWMTIKQLSGDEALEMLMSQNPVNEADLTRFSADLTEK